jgi:hypothetical protein
MNIDYEKLSGELDSGELRERLKRELVTGFRLLLDAGDPVPPASYFATKIAEIIYTSRDREIESNTQYDLYQEVLLACEEARREVLGEEPAVN